MVATVTAAEDPSPEPTGKVRPRSMSMALWSWNLPIAFRMYLIIPGLPLFNT